MDLKYVGIMITLAGLLSMTVAASSIYYNPLDDPKLAAYGFDSKLAKGEVMFRDLLHEAWGEFYRLTCDVVIQLNHTCLKYPGQLYGIVGQLNSWGFSEIEEDEGVKVRLSARSQQVGAATDMDPAKVIWLHPKAEISQDPWEWAVPSEWTVEVTVNDRTRRFSDHTIVSSPLRPRKSVEVALTLYDLMMEVETFIQYEDLYLDFPPSHEDLMGWAKELADDALSGPKGLSRLIVKGLNDAWREKFHMAVFGNKTWWYSYLSGNFSVSIAVDVDQEDNETYKAVAYGTLRYDGWFRVTGNATPLEEWQLGCADCDAFFTESDEDSFHRPSLIFSTCAQPQVIRTRLIHVHLEKYAKASAEASTEDDAVDGAVKLVRRKLRSAKAVILRWLEGLLKKLESDPLRYEEFLIPEDFEWECPR